ncbi:MAG TPA: hypothetical protein VFM29_09115 [Vicinamibacteria bacterium]|nr:hypothetical protein [Vicinamibacteria bacterium]
MDWLKNLSPILDRYQDVQPQRVPETVDRDYDQLVSNAPPQALSEGLAAAFRDDRTPAFGQMASQMFGRANPQQRANILNILLATVGPMVLQQVLARRQSGTGPAAGRARTGGLGDILGQVLGGGGGRPSAQPHVTEEQARQIDPRTVEELAREAEKKDPSIIDKVSDVYARQPDLLKVVGGAALAIALGRMASRRNTL